MIFANTKKGSTDYEMTTENLDERCQLQLEYRVRRRHHEAESEYKKEL